MKRDFNTSNLFRLLVRKAGIENENAAPTFRGAMSGLRLVWGKTKSGHLVAKPEPHQSIAVVGTQAALLLMKLLVTPTSRRFR